MERYVRVSVVATVRVDTDGSQTPVAITWPDGREFPIASANPKKRMRCEKTFGEDAFRYECIIFGKRKILYRADDGHYFVEVLRPKDPEQRFAIEVGTKGPL